MGRRGEEEKGREKRGERKGRGQEAEETPQIFTWTDAYDCDA